METNTLLKALTICEDVYQNISVWDIDGNTTVINSINGVQGCIRKKGRTATVVFRGTDSLKDWATDFWFLKKEIPYGNKHSRVRIHGGFLHAYKAQNVRGVLLKEMEGMQEVFVTGHSLGAALATLAALDIKYHNPETKVQAVVFGSPRIGNRAFQVSYDQRVPQTLRVENGNDVVTKVPFLFMGYRHVGLKLHIGAPRLPFVYSFKEHLPAAYFRSLFVKELQAVEKTEKM